MQEIDRQQGINVAFDHFVGISSKFLLLNEVQDQAVVQENLLKEGFIDKINQGKGFLSSLKFSSIDLNLGFQLFY